MRKVVLGTVVFLLGSFVLPSPAEACGDKNIDITRGVRFQRANAIQPATVLLRVGDGTDSRSVHRFKARMARAGHQVDIVADEGTLEEKILSRAYDAVIVPIQEAGSLAALLATVDSPPVLIQLMSKPGAGQAGDASGRFPYKLSMSDNAREQLLTIGAALSSR